MILVEFTLILLAAILIYAVITQLIVPAVQGKKLFPMFRNEADLRSALIELERVEAEQCLAHVVEVKSRELLKSHTELKEKDQNV